MNDSNQLIGPDFNDIDMVIEPTRLHMGLVTPDVFERHVEELLESIRRR